MLLAETAGEPLEVGEAEACSEATALEEAAPLPDTEAVAALLAELETLDLAL